mmetsp:Transcript_17232/g.27380  ORF Transcript_17232/g.27380 Transcript_17232/m.27380 type:complete len:297 (-) Transcript_17232:370-1260(-)
MPCLADVQVYSVLMQLFDHLTDPQSQWLKQVVCCCLDFFQPRFALRMRVRSEPQRVHPRGLWQTPQLELGVLPDVVQPNDSSKTGFILAAFFGASLPLVEDVKVVIQRALPTFAQHGDTDLGLRLHHILDIHTALLRRGVDARHNLLQSLLRSKRVIRLLHITVLAGRCCHFIRLCWQCRPSAPESRGLCLFGLQLLAVPRGRLQPLQIALQLLDFTGLTRFGDGSHGPSQVRYGCLQMSGPQALSSQGAAVQRFGGRFPWAGSLNCGSADLVGLFIVLQLQVHRRHVGVRHGFEV